MDVLLVGHGNAESPGDLIAKRPPPEGWTVVAFLAASLSAQVPLGTAFTYQGRLADAGTPANGSYDFEFRVFDAATDGNPVAATTLLAVPVTAGLFTVTLDFDDFVFGQARWLEIRVKPAGGGSYTTRSPRQELTAVPNALYSSRAGDALTLGGIASSGYVLAGAVIPISQGGTGATTASGALTALGAQARVTGTCSAGRYVRVVNADGTVTCGTDVDTNSGGTVTNVATGAGLTGMRTS